jgi:signal transduction histidine kinase
MDLEELYRLGMELFMADEQERTRLTDILHNGVLQAFGAAMLKAELAKKLMAVGRYAEVERELDQLRVSLAGTVDNLRDILFTLRPPPVHGRGLEPLLEELFERARTRTDVAPKLSLENVDEISEGAISLAYRIVAHTVALTQWLCPEAKIKGLTVRLADGGSVVVIELTVVDREGADGLFGPMYLYWGPRLGMLGGEISRSEGENSLRLSFRMPTAQSKEQG